MVASLAFEVMSRMSDYLTDKYMYIHMIHIYIWIPIWPISNRKSHRKIANRVHNPWYELYSSLADNPPVTCPNTHTALCATALRLVSGITLRGHVPVTCNINVVKLGMTTGDRRS